MWLYVPVVWIMQARMLAVLERSIEKPGDAGEPIARGDPIACSLVNPDVHA
jgi:hypothetical protein